MSRKNRKCFDDLVVEHDEAKGTICAEPDNLGRRWATAVIDAVTDEHGRSDDLSDKHIISGWQSIVFAEGDPFTSGTRIKKPHDSVGARSATCRGAAGKGTK